MTAEGLPSEVFVFEAADQPERPNEPLVVWAAPGSTSLEQIDNEWRRRGAVDELAQISGPWGVVLWDPRASEHLIVVDPVGVQPVYWSRTSTGEFVVASWLDRLLDQPGVDNTIDYEGVLIDSVPGLFGEEVAHRTRFAAVERIPWGRALRVRRDGTSTLEQYWDPRALPGPDPSLTLSDAAELLRERIDAAVRRLIGDEVRVGGHVSGGLDCTSVTCRGNQVLGESGRSLVAGYTWAPDDAALPRLEDDERVLLDDVATRESMTIRRVQPDESGDWYFDLDPDRYPQTTHFRERFVLPQARKDGVRIMLAGWGGDELASFNGRAVAGDLVRHGKLRAVWRQTTRRTDLTAPGGAGLARRARSFAATVFAATPAQINDLRHRAEARERRTVKSQIDEILRSASPLAADTLRTRAESLEQARNHHEYQLILLTGGQLQRRCDGWYQTGRLFDVHYRYPLLDLGVVTAALQLPWWAYWSEGWTRTAFRIAVEPWVPSSVAWNLTKTEPALFSPAMDHRFPAGARPSRPDDQRYLEMLAIAGRVSLMGRGRQRPMQSVRARPDAAPRLR